MTPHLGAAPLSLTDSSVTSRCLGGLGGLQGLQEGGGGRGSSLCTEDSCCSC